MTIRNFNTIYSSYSSEVISTDLSNQVTTDKWDNRFDGLTLFNSQVRVAKLLTVDGGAKVGTTLAASGAVNFGTTLNVVGATTLNNTLYGAGAATFGTTLAASGAVTVGGATTLNNTLYGAGNATFGGTLAASGAVTVGGATTLKSSLNVTGTTTLGNQTTGMGWSASTSGSGGASSTFSLTMPLVCGNSQFAFNSAYPDSLTSIGTVKFNKTLNVAGTGSFGALAVTGDTTLSGVLKGPPEFTIDPAGHGDVTGTVVILGNLRVQGETTTINSATLDVVDKNITVSKNSVIRADSNEAGLSIDLGYVSGASGPKDYATLIYESDADNFRVNKLVRCASGPVNVHDLTNKAYVDSHLNNAIATAGSTMPLNSVPLSVINGFKFFVISDSDQFDLKRSGISVLEDNILYIWNRGETNFDINLPKPTAGVYEVQRVYPGINMFAYRNLLPAVLVGDPPQYHWTSSA